MHLQLLLCNNLKVVYNDSEKSTGSKKKIQSVPNTTDLKISLVRKAQGQLFHYSQEKCLMNIEAARRKRVDLCWKQVEMFLVQKKQANKTFRFNNTKSILGKTEIFAAQTFQHFGQNEHIPAAAGSPR